MEAFIVQAGFLTGLEEGIKPSVPGNLAVFVDVSIVLDGLRSKIIYLT
jgi:hypothetical protein